MANGGLARKSFFPFFRLQSLLFAICWPVDRPQLIEGRRIGPEEVARIQDWLRARPGSNRTRLSRELCAAWDWRDPLGRLKDMACRNLLLRLERQGQIQLPSRKTASVNGLRNRQVVPLDHDPSLREGPLESLQPVQVQVVSEASSEARLFRFLLQRYHYLGHRQGTGENLKYLARDRQGAPLACLLFGSAAWKLAARDRWIGWEAQQRQRHLFPLANNTRLLLLPWIRTAQLASHLLAQVSQRLSADWQEKYGHPIYLLETFVESERFAAHCYRAAGWVQVGLTTGRSRRDDGLKPRVPIKAVYLKALQADALRRLAA
jgi:Druantia protein DruA